MKQKARALRKFQTDAENRLWYFLRNRRFYGFKFRRQYWVGNYIADFICIEQKLIVELDGGQHLEQIGYDEKRSRYLEGLGFKVIRFWNDQIFKEVSTVLEVIYKKLEERSK